MRITSLTSRSFVPSFSFFGIFGVFARFLEDDFVRFEQTRNLYGNFLCRAVAENELSKLALDKSNNDEIQQFAQMMIEDHTKAGDELKQLAADKNVTLPTEVDSNHKSAMNKLSGLSGEKFDDAFLKQMVKDHEATIKLFQKEADSNDDAAMKAFAAKTLPTLQSHLQMARSMAGSMKNMNRGNMNGNRDGNMNSDSDRGNMNSNRNMNSNMDMNRNMNSNSNMNSNRNRNTNSNSNTNSVNSNSSDNRP